MNAMGEDVKAALERMKEMTPDELEAFRAADHGGEFGAAHLDTVREGMGEEAPADLLADLLTAERGDPEGDPEGFLRLLRAKNAGRFPRSAEEPAPLVYQVGKVMLVGAVIDVLQNGRKVNELTVSNPERQVISLYAHPEHVLAWGGALEEWLNQQLVKVSEEAAKAER